MQSCASSRVYFQECKGFWTPVVVYAKEHIKVCTTKQGWAPFYWFDRRRIGPQRSTKLAHWQLHAQFVWYAYEQTSTTQASGTKTLSNPCPTVRSARDPPKPH
eukprot:561897-Pelagomonas_calceolata.AAC.1